jgi:branched-chain amino acid transport system permease protein
VTKPLIPDRSRIGSLFPLHLEPGTARLLVLGLAVLFLALPFVADAYIVSYFLLCFMYLSMAGSWNVITGFVGYLALGHAAFFGVGAYTSALLITHYALPWPVTAAAGGVVAAFLALLMGGLCLRLRNIFFAIATLAFSEAIRVIAASWDTLTKGGFGISLTPYPYVTPFYYAMAVCAAVTVAMNWFIARSDFGLRLIAIREDEDAAECIGVDTTRAKIIAFTLSAIPCGIAGGLYAPYISYIEPTSVFNILLTTQLIVMAIFGGAGTVIGPVIGVLLLTLMQEVFWANFPFIHRVLFGLLIVGTIRFMPAGIIALLVRRGVLPRTRSI